MKTYYSASGLMWVKQLNCIQLSGKWFMRLSGFDCTVRPNMYFFYKKIHPEQVNRALFQSLRPCTLEVAQTNCARATHIFVVHK